MSERPHCFHGRAGWKMLKDWELLARSIKKFNEISRTSSMEILEINFSHMGSYWQGSSVDAKGTENAGNMDDCTMKAGRCIQ